MIFSLSISPGILVQEVVLFVIFFTLSAENTSSRGSIEKRASKSPNPVNTKRTMRPDLISIAAPENG